jgi:hypothetical protein
VRSKKQKHACNPENTKQLKNKNQNKTINAGAHMVPRISGQHEGSILASFMLSPEACWPQEQKTRVFFFQQEEKDAIQGCS